MSECLGAHPLHWGIQLHGYRIIYSSGSSGSGDVSDGSTSVHTLTGLVNGASYTISIVGRSLHLSSEVVGVDIGLGE